MKYATDEGLRKLRAIAERAYVRGSETCKVSPIALMAVLDEINAAQQSVQRTATTDAEMEAHLEEIHGMGERELDRQHRRR